MMERLRDREQAGRLLAKKLARYSNRPDVLVLGLPRGGMQVAYAIASALGVSLDVLIVRKLGVPGYKEFPMGAVSIGGAQFINLDVVEEFHLSQEEVEEVVSTELGEMARLEHRAEVASCDTHLRGAPSRDLRSMFEAAPRFSSTTVWPPGQRCGRRSRRSRGWGRPASLWPSASHLYQPTCYSVRKQRRSFV